MTERSGAVPLPPNLIVARADGETLLCNIAAFAAVLRRAGIGGGMHKTAAAAEALSLAGVESRDDAFWALATVFVEKRGQMPLFRRAFHLFWHGMAVDDGEEGEGPDDGEFSPFGDASLVADAAAGKPSPDMAHTATDIEYLREKDFEQMTEEEMRVAGCLAQEAATMLPPPLSRRKRPASRGQPDMRRAVRRALARGGDDVSRLFCRPRPKQPRLIVLVDISGSMGAYSRAFLHFVAGMLALGEARVHAFLLGTRLTALPKMRGDAEQAARRIAASAEDWDGGTRLTSLLREFNRKWLRRSGAHSAAVLFATDGLEIDCDRQEWAGELERLRKSCRRLIWLNPLLRYDRYEPLAQGAAVLARHADESRSIHNVRAVADLSCALSAGTGTKLHRYARES